MPAPQTRRARAQRRRVKRVAASGSDLTELEWFAILDAWAACAYCGADGAALQRDCVLPISRGGRYTLDNVVPACRSCNASKCNEEVTTWMRRRRLDEPAFLLRWRQIVLALAAETASAPPPTASPVADDDFPPVEGAIRDR
ncbi:HNH endonuclease signature motif containing protein [Microbacterium sp. zg-Y818]|uniref:HNH endonuclease n=1 Tax=unclassified Microbacterium TaxID=2609290 RepID=UPI00214B2021|nr:MULTISPECIES: HNH endonuclease signature motif containing protein [unclassified Microbacterium]MCR2799753.1 HNH endonuclease [Microbacterium sp. zg.Y818]WIM21739.1 HNH endonuclease signature motif containing protein [Microbacterium sp. zg-Y818]